MQGRTVLQWRHRTATQGDQGIGVLSSNYLVSTAVKRRTGQRLRQDNMLPAHDCVMCGSSMVRQASCIHLCRWCVGWMVPTCAMAVLHYGSAASPHTGVVGPWSASSSQAQQGTCMVQVQSAWLSRCMAVMLAPLLQRFFQLDRNLCGLNPKVLPRTLRAAPAFRAASHDSYLLPPAMVCCIIQTWYHRCLSCAVHAVSLLRPPFMHSLCALLTLESRIAAINMCDFLTKLTSSCKAMAA